MVHNILPELLAHSLGVAPPEEVEVTTVPAFRTPGPLGLQARPDPVLQGFSIPADFGSEEYSVAVASRSGRRNERSGAGTSNVEGRPVLVRRTQGSARVPLLRIGSSGDEVRKLQALLNLRLAPSPGLRVDGHLGPLTAAALQQLQHAAQIQVDAIAGKDTWRVLGLGQVFTMVMSEQAPLAYAIPTTASPSPETGPSRSPQTLIDDVLGWTAERKFLDVAQRAINKLPGAARTELVAMVSPNAVGVTLAIWAASHMVGAGAVIDLALLGAGVFLIGTAVFGVVEELSHFLVKTYSAANQQDLEDASGMLANVIAVIGVTALVALLSKVRPKGGGGGKAGVAAEAESAAATSSRRMQQQRQPKAKEAGVATQRSTSTRTASRRQTGAGGSAESADEAYARIRSSSTDVSAIANNTGIKASNIQKVKNHLFYEEHLLDRYESLGVPGNRARFDSSTDIAAAWRRLQSGSFNASDVQLLRHETAEAWYMRKYGPSYNNAHNAAQMRYPSPLE